MSIIKQYLKQEIELIKTMHRNKIGGYLSVSEFIYKNGQLFKPGPLPKNVRRGPMKQCFRNAALLSMETSYYYAEGYALSIIPTIHAWCINKKGKVIDPTWEDGKEYYGIVIKKSYLLKYLLKYKRYGLIENWEDGYPLLKLNKKIWQKKIL